MSSDKELGDKLARDTKYSRYDERFIPDEANGTVIMEIRFGGNMVGTFTGTLEKKSWAGHSGRAASQADTTPADEGALPTAEAIEGQKNSPIMPGVAKTPDGEEWQKKYPGGLTERQQRKLNKERG
jgi:hypothetical protein